MGIWPVCGGRDGRRGPLSGLPVTCADNGRNVRGRAGPQSSTAISLQHLSRAGRGQVSRIRGDGYRGQATRLLSVGRPSRRARGWRRYAVLPRRIYVRPRCAWGNTSPLLRHVRAGDLLGQGGGVLSVGTSLLPVAARFSDAGSWAAKVAWGSLDRFLLSRASHVRISPCRRAASACTAGTAAP